MRVLSINPEYGVAIARHGGLRKMRVALPRLRIGKRGGYRCIYRRARIDEIEYVVFLEIFYKGDVDDLSRAVYAQLASEAERILSDPLSVDWVDPPAGTA